MVVPKQGQFEHKIFTDIEDYLLPGDVLVVNETAVLPARLLGLRESTGAHIEVLLLKQVGEDDGKHWCAPAAGSRKENG